MPNNRKHPMTTLTLLGATGETIRWSSFLVSLPVGRCNQTKDQPRIANERTIVTVTTLGVSRPPQI